MRALTLAAPTGLEQLAVREVPAPGPPAAHDVRIAVRAAALNRLDLFVGEFQLDTRFVHFFLLRTWHEFDFVRLAVKLESHLWFQDLFFDHLV